MSAGVPLPHCVFSHGFVSAADGRKMSKSFGNVVDPLAMLEKYSPDTFRYFIVKEARFGSDLRFDEDSLIDVHNADLADSLGNLLQRCIALCAKYCGGRVPDVPLPPGPAPFNVDEVVARVEDEMKTFALQEVVEVAVGACRDTNKFLTDWAPWQMNAAGGGGASGDKGGKKEQQSTQPSTATTAVTNTSSSPCSVQRLQQQVVRGVLEAVYVLAHLFFPVIPRAAEDIATRLGTPLRTLVSLSSWFDNLTPNTLVTPFPAVPVAAAAVAGGKAGGGGSSGGAKSGGNTTTPGVLFAKIAQRKAEIFLQQCELRVGEVTKVQRVSTSSKGKGGGDGGKKAGVAANAGGAAAAEGADGAVTDGASTASSTQLLSMTVALSDSGSDNRAIVFSPSSATGGSNGEVWIGDVKLSLDGSGGGDEGIVGRKVFVLCNIKPVKVGGMTSNGVLLTVKAKGKGTGPAVAEILSVPPCATRKAVQGSVLEARGFPIVLRNRESVTKGDVTSNLRFDAGPSLLLSTVADEAPVDEAAGGNTAASHSATATPLLIGDKAVTVGQGGTPLLLQSPPLQQQQQFPLEVVV